MFSMADPGEPARKPDENRRDATVPHHVYPEPLTQEDLDAMDGTLPDDVTAAHLRWLETGEGDPWGGYSG
jgi:hypothetical protein